MEMELPANSCGTVILPMYPHAMAYRQQKERQRTILAIARSAQAMSDSVSTSRYRPRVNPSLDKQSALQNPCSYWSIRLCDHQLLGPSRQLVAVSGSELFYPGASAVSPSANHLHAIDLQITLQLTTTCAIPSSMQFVTGL